MIDKEIVRLFEERMSVCGDVAEYKIGTGKAVYDAAREAQKIAAVQELAHSEFNKEAVRRSFPVNVRQPQIPVQPVIRSRYGNGHRIYGSGDHREEE